jgi:hypothetical protein
MPQIMKCIDCSMIVDVKENKSKNEVTRWTICKRCQLKRSGFGGAKSARELGIY